MDASELNPEDASFGAIWSECQPYTMTSFERGLALFRAIRYLHQNFIPGDFVECGVWRGGSTMIAMKTLQQFGIVNRRFWLFDTFKGMTRPVDIDVDYHGQSAEDLLRQGESQRTTDLAWAYAGLEEVRHNVALTGYDMSLVHFVEGDVCETLLQAEVGQIALLRLDTDFYESTKIELEVLFPRLAEEGVLIVDDFGHWQGARKAMDEYFDNYLLSGQTRPYSERIDYTGRLVIKPRPKQRPGPSERHDWLAPGLARANLIDKFPEMIERDPTAIMWPYLRKGVPHIWRTDSRSYRLPDTGAISVEEAELLYNNALPFAGLRGLEIGCHFGWSSAHLAKAGLILDVVDPALQHDDQLRAVTDSVTRAGSAHPVQFWPAYSPGILPAIRASQDAPYSFAFIDGYHEGEAPRKDAEMVATLCAETACVMFHDLNSPFVAAGLAAMKAAGWQTGWYNTMQIVGIAWRGDFHPVAHTSDPQIPVLPIHFLSMHILLSC